MDKIEWNDCIPQDYQGHETRKDLGIIKKNDYTWYPSTTCILWIGSWTRKEKKKKKKRERDIVGTAVEIWMAPLYQVRLLIGRTVM